MGPGSIDLLTTAAKDERIATFQPHHMRPRRGMGDEQLFDLSLRVTVSLTLSDRDPNRCPRCQVEESRVGEAIVQNDVRFTNCPRPANGN